MEAGRLAAEYLVAKGVLPPASLQRGGGAGVGWGQMPPAPPLPQAQEAPAFYESRRNGRQRLDDEYGNPNPRSRRNHGGDYNGGDNGNYNGRGKRKFGAYNRNSEWGRDRERSRDYLDSRNYGDDDEEDRAPAYRRDRRVSAGIDEVGSSISGVAGERQTSKVEAVGESELEDTGSKVSSNSNVRKDADAVQGMQNENEANKMEEDSKVSDSEVVEKGINSESIHNNASSGVVEEGEIDHSPLPSDDKPDDGSIMDEKSEHDKSLDEKGSSVENNLHDGCQNLLSSCNFARAPTRPRSILAHRNGASTHRDAALTEQVDLAPLMVIDEAANDSSLNNVQGDNKDDHVCLEHTDPSVACNQMMERVRLQEEEEAQTEIRDMEEQNNTAQHYTVQEIKECDGLNPTLASQHDCSKLQVREEVQIYNIDTPPQDKDLIDSADKGKTTDSVELLPNIKDEALVTIKEEDLGQSSSFKICDLNLIGSPELADIRNDPGFGQCSNVVCSMEVQNQQHFDFGTAVGNNASNTDMYAQIPLNDKVIQIIDIEDDPPIQPSVSDASRPKSEMVYPSMDNMMNSSVNTNIFPGTQDGYNIAIPDFLGADMPCYPPLHADLHAEMGLNDPEVITVMDDPIYDSLGDIGFMEVWDQQPPDYKFF